MFFPNTHGTFTIGYILGYKMHLNKFEGISSLRLTFSQHCTVKLEVNNRKMSSKYRDRERFTKTLLTHS